MSERGEVITMSAVRFTRHLPASPARAWELLTETSRLPAWFGNGVIEPRVGGKVRLMDNHIRGTVTTWDAPHRLTYTWSVFDPNDPESAQSEHPESYLQLELEARGKETLLTLTHFPIPEAFQKQTSMGWHTYLDLTEAAARGDLSLTRADLMQKNAELYGVDLNNLAR